MSDLRKLLFYIRERQKQICIDNSCKNDEHNCESYAYISKDYQLLDICLPDYFIGSNKSYAAISLPLSDALSVDEFKVNIDEQLSN